MTPEQRFFAKVNKTDTCWWWIGATHGSRQKRGMFWDGKRTVDACRWIYQQAHAGVEMAGVVVRHTCDNALCVNPKHLELGTQAENVADMWERGRANIKAIRRGAAMGRETLRRQPERRARGLRHGRARLSDEDVAQIVSSAEGTATLASRYGVHRTTIQRIRRGSARNTQTNVAACLRAITKP